MMRAAGFRRGLPWLCHGRRERGSLSVELVIVTPGLVLLLLLVGAAGRVVGAQGHLDGAARDAARAASIAPPPQQAGPAARHAAQGDQGESSGCNANSPNCGSGPCRTDVQWGPNEIAADLGTELFPPHVAQRDHLYRIRCRITHGGAGATCVGVRRFGSRPRQLVSARALLRSNGTWDLICWPNPSSLCDKVQIREQRRDPYTIPGG